MRICIPGGPCRIPSRADLIDTLKAAIIGNPTLPTLAPEYDYIVVGAGSAGCVIAKRLAASGASVLLVEAGDDDNSPLIHIPGTRLL